MNDDAKTRTSECRELYISFRQLTRAAIGDLGADADPGSSMAVQILTMFVLALVPTNPLSLTDTARQLGVSRPWMGRVVTQLTLLGYVERRENPHDDRITLLRLTANGSQVAGRLVSLIGVVMAEFSPSERLIISKFMKTIHSRSSLHASGFKRNS